MTLRDEALALRGTRVRADFADRSVLAELRAVTPRGDLLFAGPGGVEYPLPLDALERVVDARYVCPRCDSRVNYVFAGREDSTLLCADCERARAYDLPPPLMDCEDCGDPGAFRSPKTQAWRCASCHHRARTLSGLGSERRVLESLEHLKSDCRSADIHSPLHSWQKFGGQHVCRRCRTKTRFLSDADAAS